MNWENKILYFNCNKIFSSTYLNRSLTISARAEITFPKVVSDLLIFAPSCENKDIQSVWGIEFW